MPLFIGCFYASILVYSACCYRVRQNAQFLKDVSTFINTLPTRLFIVSIETAAFLSGSFITAPCTSDSTKSCGVIWRQKLFFFLLNFREIYTSNLWNILHKPEVAVIFILVLRLKKTFSAVLGQVNQECAKKAQLGKWFGYSRNFVEVNLLTSTRVRDCRHSRRQLR